MNYEIKDYTWQMRIGNAIMDKEREDIVLRLDRLIGDSNGNSKYRSDQ